MRLRFFHHSHHRARHYDSRLIVFSVVILFWALYDGVISYITPVIISQQGFSPMMLGIILASSSVAGAIFDFILTRILKNANYRRMYLLMFAVCLAYPLLLSSAKTVWMYLIVMALWGLYYDLQTFGRFDYVGRYVEKSKHAGAFGTIGAFHALGYLLAPLVLSYFLGVTLGFIPFVLAYGFLAISLVVFIVFAIKRRQDNPLVPELESNPPSAKVELKRWRAVGRLMLPILGLTFLMSMIDALFWTIGPIFSEQLIKEGWFGGLLLPAYTIPSLFVSWSVNLFSRFDKKMTIFVLLLGGFAILGASSFAPSAWMFVVLIFIASSFWSIAWPMVSSIYADAISETPEYEKEIEGLEDLAVNGGYIVGPLLAGFLAEQFGNVSAFSLLGLFAFMTVLAICWRVGKKNLAFIAKTRCFT